MSKYDQLEKIKTLRDEGVLSEEEYEREKQRILAADVPADAEGDFKPWGMEVKDYCMFLHLSQLAGILVPAGGIVLPIVMWAMNKDRDERIDAHGRIVLNWMISSLIYAVVCTILIFVFLIGVPLLIALVIAEIVFVILGAVKASRNELWPYPMSIQFFSLPQLGGEELRQS